MKLGQKCIRVCSSGSSTFSLLEQWDNASRVVYSMVIEGLRYGSNPLLEMRIHDITLLTDLSRHDPNHPDEEQQYDGCGTSLDEPLNADPEVEQEKDYLLSLAEDVLYWWQQLWPRLHAYYSSLPSATSTLIIHISVDILGDVRVEDLLFDTTLDDELTAQQKTTLQNEVDDAIWNARGGWYGEVGRILGISLAAIDTLAAYILLPGTQTAFSIAIAAWCTVFGIWIWWMLESVNQGLLSPIQGAAWILNFQESYLFQVVIFAGAWAGAAWLGMTYEDFPALFDNNGLKGYWMIFLIALKIGVIIVTSHIYSTFYEMAMEEVGAS